MKITHWHSSWTNRRTNDGGNDGWVERPKPKTLYSVHSFNTEYFPHDAVGDIFFYSDSFTYDIIANTYNYLPQISPDIFPPDVKVESILAYLIRIFDIKNVRLKMDPDIIR